MVVFWNVSPGILADPNRRKNQRAVPLMFVILLIVLKSLYKLLGFYGVVYLIPIDLKYMKMEKTAW